MRIIDYGSDRVNLMLYILNLVSGCCLHWGLTSAFIGANLRSLVFPPRAIFKDKNRRKLHNSPLETKIPHYSALLGLQLYQSGHSTEQSPHSYRRGLSTTDTPSAAAFSGRRCRCRVDSRLCGLQSSRRATDIRCNLAELGVDGRRSGSVGGGELEAE